MADLSDDIKYDLEETKLLAQAMLEDGDISEDFAYRVMAFMNHLQSCKTDVEIESMLARYTGRMQ